jgi:hypothetical protein
MAAGTAGQDAGLNIELRVIRRHPTLGLGGRQCGGFRAFKRSELSGRFVPQIAIDAFRHDRSNAAKADTTPNCSDGRTTSSEE